MTIGGVRGTIVVVAMKEARRGGLRARRNVSGLMADLSAVD